MFIGHLVKAPDCPALLKAHRQVLIAWRIKPGALDMASEVPADVHSPLCLCLSLLPPCTFSAGEQFPQGRTSAHSLCCSVPSTWSSTPSPPHSRPHLHPPGPALSAERAQVIALPDQRERPHPVCQPAMVWLVVPRCLVSAWRLRGL